MEWCDDERNVHVFLKHEPALPEHPNIWKEVHEHLQECANKSMYNEIKYTEYNFEPIGNITDEDQVLDDEPDEETITTELNEDLEYNSEYAYI